MSTPASQIIKWCQNVSRYGKIYETVSLDRFWSSLTSFRWIKGLDFQVVQWDKMMQYQTRGGCDTLHLINAEINSSNTPKGNTILRQPTMGQHQNGALLLRKTSIPLYKVSVVAQLMAAGIHQSIHPSIYPAAQIQCKPYQSAPLHTTLA